MDLLPLDNAKAKAKEKARESDHILRSRKKPKVEMMMVMMKIRSREKTSPNNNPNIPITTSTCPTWKLYENPFYISHHPKPQQIHQNHHPDHNQQDSTAHQKQIHRLHLPVSARKIAASFWDLTFIKPFMESELEMARAQIMELKAKLESQCKARKKMENLNKNLSRELSEERKLGREAIERVYQVLAKEMSIYKAEINRMKKEIEEERKMLRTAEVIREERVQMKLAEAKILLEEKLSELEIAIKEAKLNSNDQHQENIVNSHHQSSFGEKRRFVLGENMAVSINIGNSRSTAVMQRKAYPEAENPHIKRGIKGFVEYPKVVRAKWVQK